MKTYENCENAGVLFPEGYENYEVQPRVQQNVPLTGFSQNGMYRPATAAGTQPINQIPMNQRQPLIAMRMNSMRPIQMPMKNVNMPVQHYSPYMDRCRMAYTDQQYVIQQNNMQNQLKMSTPLNMRGTQIAPTMQLQSYDQNENQTQMICRRVNPGLQSAASSAVPMPMNPHLDRPYIEIVEQPASRAMRFRYQCEGRPAGNIPGVHSTPEKKSFPSIKVHNFTGKVKIVVSCVTEHAPYRVHPHKITSKEHAEDGIICLTVDGGEVVKFSSLGIQCAKKKDVVQCILEREAKKIDPFENGYDHKMRPTTIDLNAVRLAFQGFIKTGTKYVAVIPPVVSDPIYDKKSMYDLIIVKMSHYSASASGGTEMILLCEKVSKDDIQIRFFEEVSGEVVWEGLGNFTSSDVHKQTAITFRTPSYENLDIEHPVKVSVELRRPSDGAISSPIEFEMLPIVSNYDTNYEYERCKRYKTNEMGNERCQLKLSDVLPKELGQFMDNNNTNVIQSNGNFNFQKLTEAQSPKPQLAATIPKTIQLSPQFGLQYNNQRIAKNENSQNGQIELQYMNQQQSNYEIPLQNQNEMTNVLDNYYDENQFLNVQQNYYQNAQQKQLNFDESDSQLGLIYLQFPE